jgi:hypothetical protein
MEQTTVELHSSTRGLNDDVDCLLGVARGGGASGPTADWLCCLGVTLGAVDRGVIDGTFCSLGVVVLELLDLGVTLSTLGTFLPSGTTLGASNKGTGGNLGAACCW